MVVGDVRVVVVEVGGYVGGFRIGKWVYRCTVVVIRTVVVATERGRSLGRAWQSTTWEEESKRLKL
jgi:hypothetical protein